MPLLFEPGEGWAYGSGIDWAGQIVERVNGGIRLGEYMKTHIWERLGMDSTTFRINQHENARTRLCSMTTKTGSGELLPGSSPRDENPKDDLGGGGLYSSPNDYMKLLISLLKNDGLLLKSESVKQMFESHLLSDQDIQAFAQDPVAGPMCRAGVPSQAWTFGLGGILNRDDVPGVCKKGTMSWGGLPNLFWVSTTWSQGTSR